MNDADPVLVTGAAGFIGFHVARRLLEQGRAVIGLDSINQYYDPRLKEARLAQLTPFPATPLYDRLKKEGRLTRPTHWLDFAPFQMSHTPLKISISQVQGELKHAWESSYNARGNAEAIEALSHKPVGWRVYHLLARLSFRGIYFPQMGWTSWLKVLGQNRSTLFKLAREGARGIIRGRRGSRREQGEYASRLSLSTVTDDGRPQEATPLHR